MVIKGKLNRLIYELKKKKITYRYKMKKKNASYFSNIYVHLTHALYKLYQQKFTASPCCFMASWF